MAGGSRAGPPAASKIDNPPPAVIHCVSPSVMRPPPPLEFPVPEDPVEQVGDGLEAPVRVPGGALGSPGA
jgi:hypothetical protein